VFRLHLDYIERNEGIPRLVFSEEIHGHNKGLKEKLLDTINGYAARLELIIKEGQEMGSIKKDVDPRSSALTFIGMIQVAILRWILSDFSFPLVREGMPLWENFEKCVQLRDINLSPEKRATIITKDQLNRRYPNG
jgi:hypothetical protein